MGGSKSAGNTPPDSELRNLAVPLPVLRKPIDTAVQEGFHLFNKGKPGQGKEWEYGPGVVQPWNWAQQGGFDAGTRTAGQVAGILDPSASFVSRAGGGEFIGRSPGQGTLDAYAGGNWVGQGPGQSLLNRFGAGEFIGNTPGQGTLNNIAGGNFERPAVGAYDEILTRARGGSGALGLIGDTAGGEYLQGNPHLEGVIRSQARDIQRDYGDAVAGIEGRMSAAGRLGSNSEAELQGRAQENLARTLGDLQDRTRYQDYAGERQLQQQAQLALPGAFATDIGTGLNAANARAGDEWQALQAMLSGANAAGGLFQNSQAQALQGAGMAGDSARADRSLQVGAAQAAGQGYRDSLAQGLQAAGMAPGQAAAQFLPADAMLRYGGLAQQQGERAAAEGQERFRYGQEAEWNNLQRLLTTLQGAAGITNPNAGALGLQGQQGGASGLTDITGLLGTLALAGGTAYACDARLKADIDRIGDLADGSGLYRFRYAWDDPGTIRIGPMAHEVAAINPGAVINAGGVLMVDMGRWLH